MSKELAVTLGVLILGGLGLAWVGFSVKAMGWLWGLAACALAVLGLAVVLAASYLLAWGLTS